MTSSRQTCQDFHRRSLAILEQSPGIAAVFKSAGADPVTVAELCEKALKRLPKTGDVAYVHRTTRVFPVEDAAAEQLRCRGFEISPSGPLFGTRTPQPEGEPGRLEQELLAETGLTREDFRIGGGLNLKGLRRSLRIPLKEAALSPCDAATSNLIALG